MKRIALIALIAFILLLPGVPLSLNNPGNLITHHFKENEAPAIKNTDGVSIGLINNGSDLCHSNFNASKTRYPFYVEGANYYNRSGVYFLVNSSALSLNMSWNENESYSMTESYYHASYEGHSISGCFGLKYGSYFTVIQNQSETKILKLDQNTFYALSFSFLGNHVEIKVCSQNTLSFAGMFNSSSSKTYSSALNLTVEGNYYNLNFQKPCVSNHLCEAYSPLLQQPNTTAQKGNSSISGLGAGDFTCDSATGTFTFVKNNDSIVEYNPSSNRSNQIYSSGTAKIICSVSGNSATYWIIKNESGSNYCVEELNNSNLTLLPVQAVDPPHGNFRTVIINNGLSFYNNTQVIYALNGSLIYNYSAVLNKTWAIGGISQHSGTICLYFRNESGLSSYNTGDGKLVYFKNFSTISPLKTQSGQAYFGISYRKNQSSFYYPGLNAISSNPLIFIKKSMAVLACSNQTAGILSISTNSEEFITVSGILLHSFSKSIISLSGTTINFYLMGNSSSPDLNIVAPANQLFSPEGYFNFTISGTSGFVSNISIGGICREGNNQTAFYLNLSSMASGIHDYTLKIITGTLYYTTRTGIVTVDSSYPNLAFAQKTNNGIYSGEVLCAKYSDSISIRNISAFGINYTVNAHMSTISFFTPYRISGDSLSFSVVFKDIYNVSRSITLSFRFYGENSSKILPDIYENEIFNSKNLHITFRGNSENVSSLILEVKNLSSGKKFNFSSSTNSTHLFLPNGNYTMSTFGLFRPGNLDLMNIVNFSVLSKNLSILSENKPEKYYSFYGNSENNSFHFRFNANIQGTWSVSIMHNLNLLYSERIGNKSIYLNSTGLENVFRENGTFSIYFNYSSINHHFHSSEINLLVNNSVPYFTSPSNYFTNRPALNISGTFRTNGKICIGHNGTMLDFNGSFILGRPGNYTFQLEIWSDSMNHLFRNITVKFNESRPEFDLAGFTPALENSPHLKLHILEGSGYKISRVFMEFNGKEITENASAIYLSFNSDGPYNFTIEVEDKCGNINKTTYYLNVTYFPYVSKITLSYRIFFQSFTAEAHITGYNTSPVDIRWFINGEPYSSGRFANTSLPTGFDRIYVMAKYGNESKYYNLTIPGISSYYVIPAPAILIFAYAAKNLPVNRNSDELLNTILSGDDNTLKYIVRKLRRKHFTRSRIKKVFNLLIEREIVKISPDPDGRLRLEILTNNKKK